MLIVLRMRTKHDLETWMAAPRNGWNPQSPIDWARALGLVRVPMFGPGRAEKPGTTHSILLDGRRASFSLSTGNVGELLNSQQPLSWSWSSHVRHAVLIAEEQDVVILWRWDDPERIRRFRIPQAPSGAQALLQRLDQSEEPRLPGVVEWMLELFRRLRSAVDACGGGPFHVIRSFNILLAGIDAVVNQRGVTEAKWRNCNTLHDVITAISPWIRSELDTADFSEKILLCDVRPLIEAMVDPDPATGYRLDPDLLIRHASGELYQEAHFQLERPLNMQGLLFPGYIYQPVRHGTPKREARFTPPALARTLVEQAFAVLRKQGKLPEILTVLDPACGCGVFLQESLREMENKNWAAGKMRLLGMDNSEVACSIARFCLQREVADHESVFLETTFSITQKDALQEDWGTPSIIVMNPPFAAWNVMSAEERAAVRLVLGDLATDHTDKSMAFIWKAAVALKQGGVLACVMPSPVLESKAGKKWRQARMALSVVPIGVRSIQVAGVSARRCPEVGFRWPSRT